MFTKKDRVPSFHMAPTDIEVQQTLAVQPYLKVAWLLSRPLSAEDKDATDKKSERDLLLHHVQNMNVHTRDAILQLKAIFLKDEDRKEEENKIFFSGDPAGQSFRSKDVQSFLKNNPAIKKALFEEKCIESLERGKKKFDRYSKIANFTSGISDFIGASLGAIIHGSLSHEMPKYTDHQSSCGFSKNLI